ncbi:5'-nucleotidase, C-terminal domain [Maribacter sedimenticola]|uniref:5'-nucleotidase, C-terminal domain n=1 Tax=Maribacter sedimenticola TaxID=228956 RepID=A0ABY1SH28_9FLAO|nr:5'-nucleotidase [Maribacter sedimenticola]SNR44046.1 5'-nucleotidase, C-terminal domain [Maribacter sedimenticola]
MAKLKHFDYLKIKHFVIFITISLFLSCKEGIPTISSIEGNRITIDSNSTTIDSIQEFITPYHDRIEEILTNPLAYAPFTISKTDGQYNTTAGNLMADIVLQQSQPIFKQRTGNNIDVVLLNHGGIRATISKGNVTARTAYEVMPFENTVVVVELKGSSLLKMIDYLSKAKRAHPIAGMQLVLNKDYSVHTFSINGKPLNKEQTYFVATSNYLVTGGDNMNFFKEYVSITETEYKIRNAMIDYFTKVDTLAPKVDSRFYQLQ